MMGAVGADSSTRQISNLIQLWSTNPPQDISYEEVQDIQSNQYGLKTENLNASERKQLADIVYNEVVNGGASANNSMKTVDDINNSAVAQIKLGGFTSDELKIIARLAAKIHTTASMFAFEDALALLGYYNK